MKRSAGSDFDEEGAKWFQSPHYKEVKTDMTTEDQIKDYSKRIPADFDKEISLTRERFYDFLNRISRDGDFKLDLNEVNAVLNVRVEEIPDNYKITTIFEELNSKQNLITRGKKNWNETETMFLIWIVMAYSRLYDRDYNDMNTKDWEGIVKVFPGKTGEQCKSRWQSLLKLNLTKAPWSQDEDNLLCSIITEKGPKKWKEIAFELNKRNENKVFRQGKQCRERWINHLDPAVNRGAWTSDEDLQLLEAHVKIGKKWAEIAKILRNRTENSVKNRWNSLMKKYKGEYGIDSDTMSTSSAHSNMSMEDLERKVSEMIISKRKKHMDDSPNNILNEQIMEVPEEDSSPGYTNDFYVETTIPKTEDGFRGGSGTKIDESNGMNDNFSKKGGKKKPATSVSMAKNNLRELVNVEMQNQPQGQGFAQNDTNMNMQQDQNTNQPLFVFGANVRPVSNNPMTQDMNMFPQGNNEQQQNIPTGGKGLVYNMTNDILGLNMWRNNLNNYNVFSQNPQQNNLASNFLLYNQAPVNQQTNYNIAPASLSNLDFPQKQNSNPAGHTADQENKAKTGESKFEMEEGEPRVHKLTERSINHFNANEVGQSNLVYAIVDLTGNQVYLMDPLSKDNFPPPANQIKTKPSLQNIQNPGSLDIIANSPAMNHTSWTSPPINSNGLLNYPLFNNPLASFGFAKQFSPNINLFHESPKFDQNMFGTTPKMEGRSDWTPETMNRPMFSNLNMKQRLGMANSRGDTPPDVKIGATGGAFNLRRMDNKAGLASNPLHPEGMKYSSPSSFLQSSQSNHLNRNKV